MAVDWYLLKPPHGQLSGFESEALDGFAQEGFEEILDSSAAVDVELCNYDLSICKPMKAIIQHNVDDTRLKTLTREVYFPIGTCKAGMYVKYKGRYWLITGLVDDNKMYEKGIMAICNYLITWQTKDNRICQRWANVTSASQYNNGETSVTLYAVGTDQILILTPDDDDSILLSAGQRFIIDKRCSIYEKSFGEEVVCDTSNPLITYEITRSDSVLYNYGDSGHHQIMATQDTQHENDGYYVINGKGYWLCEEPAVEDKGSHLLSEIEYDSLDIFNGLEPCVFVPKFYGVNGKRATIIPHWEINCDFVDQLNVEYIDDSICISANDKKLINKSFELSLSADNYDPVSVTVTIRAFM